MNLGPVLQNVFPADASHDSDSTIAKSLNVNVMVGDRPRSSDPRECLYSAPKFFLDTRLPQIGRSCELSRHSNDRDLLVPACIDPGASRAYDLQARRLASLEFAACVPFAQCMAPLEMKPPQIRILMNEAEAKPRKERRKAVAVRAPFESGCRRAPKSVRSRPLKTPAGKSPRPIFASINLLLRRIRRRAGMAAQSGSIFIGNAQSPSNSREHFQATASAGMRAGRSLQRAQSSAIVPLSRRPPG